MTAFVPQQVRRLRIALVVSHLTPKLGLEGATLALADALGREHEVRVVCLAEDANDALRHQHVEVETLGSSVRGVGRVRTIARAARWCRTARFDVIILSGAWAALPVLSVLSRKSLRRTIVWEHSFSHANSEAKRSVGILRAFARRLYTRAQFIVAVSASLKRDLLSAGFKQEIRVINNLVPSNEPRGLPRQPGRIAMVGALRRVKNQPLAIEALAMLPDQFALDIVGDGPERANLQDIASRLQVSDRVHFHGFVDSPADLMAQASVIVHPSLDETFGLVLFEAADQFRPVVVVDRGSMADFVPDLVPGVRCAPTAASFAAAIASLNERGFDEAAMAKARKRRKHELGEMVIQEWKAAIDDLLLRQREAAA